MLFNPFQGVYMYIFGVILCSLMLLPGCWNNKSKDGSSCGCTSSYAHEQTPATDNTHEAANDTPTKEASDASYRTDVASSDSDDTKE